ncbi:MAG TPA: Wzz/FepE/Etk N-terminal domain-containing protein [Anaerolineae bacterium]|nr:Wzz/FepE/Etk N-terminal domain-containing protein [Anaerolineae bacterium]
MEDEIDLRAYVEVLLRHWYWIVALAVLAAAAAFVYTSFQPAEYKARSVVIITQPRYQMQFDPRFETQLEVPTYKAFPTLAASDGVLQSVVDAYSPSEKGRVGQWTLTTLRKMVEATSEGDPSLVVLTVRSRSAEDAAAIANVWAGALVKRGRELYGQGEADVAFFEAQVQEAQLALDQAESALVEFQMRNQVSIVTAQLDSLKQAQTEYLERQRAVTYIIQDVEGLRAQLPEQTDDQTASLADNLTALLLQIKAFNAETETPVQLQVDGNTGFSGKSMAEQRAFLDSLVKTLQAKSAEIDDKLAELEPQILASQRDLQVTTVESDRLTRARDLSRDTYMTLARKLEEARISTQEANGALHVGSQAAIPGEPVGPRRLFNTAVAGVAAVLVGTIAAFLLDFLRLKKAAGEKASPALRSG